MAKVRTVPIEDAPAAAGLRPVVTLVPLGPELKVDALDPDAPGTGSRSSPRSRRRSASRASPTSPWRRRW